MVRRVLFVTLGALAVMVLMGSGCDNGSSPKPAADVFKVLTPVAGASYKVGDSITITWDEPSTTSKVNVNISVDDGIDWTLCLTSGSVPAGVKHFTYGIPSTLLDPTVQSSTTCQIRVSEYTDETKNAESSDFTIHK